MTGRPDRGAADGPPGRLAAERVFGVRFDSFLPLSAGNSSSNFRATAAGGGTYLVKFAPPHRLEKIVRRARAVVSPLVPALAFGARVGECGGSAFCAFEWLGRGASVDPAAMTPARCASLVAAYRGLSAAMRAAEDGLDRPADLDGAGFTGGLRAVHGDMHCGNLFFDGDEVVAFFDLEKMRIGHPAEDLLRVFAHALERTRFWRRARIRAILGAFERTARLSGIARADWLAAIRLCERRKAASRARKSRFGFFKSVEARLRAPLYRALRDAASRAAEEAPA